ncbi:MAG: DegT/DnrJ/EryC1/StrS family aminotransferase, partial [Candidatus Hydrogenedentes bacterium]|nr:DegT/DnrJ/EryC1/StrS family aminotransferase [Candidatus Hydrogenedentota bacterium]
AGVRPDDEVLVSSLSFIAPANAVKYIGAWPVFIDAEPEFWQMDPNLVERFLVEECETRDGHMCNRRTGRRVTAILPAHILGHPVDMDPILDLARQYGLAVIEDAAESFGAKYKKRKVGAIADVACLSFNGNKLITTGGGGMIVTNNEEWADRARYLTTQARDDETEYVHREIGFNYRLTNIQAAIGCAQMERIGKHISAKRRIARTYAQELDEINGISLMREATWASAVFWLYTLRIDPDLFGMDSRALRRYLSAKGIRSRPLWQPLHISPAFHGTQHVGGKIAETLWQEGLSIPCSVTITKKERDAVVSAIKSASNGVG